MSCKITSIDVITLEEVLNNYVFNQMEGLTFTECAVEQAIKNNSTKRQMWDRWSKRWNYEVKGKTIKFQYSIGTLKPLLYYYDNNEIEICTVLMRNRVDTVQEYKNGSTAVKFLSEAYALEFAKKYLGYIEMTDEERKELEIK